MGLFDIFKKKKEETRELNYPQYSYGEKEIVELENFITNHIGDFKNVFHEIYSPDIHLDVCIVDPTDDEPYYKLVTMGAGAYYMDIPESLQRYQLNRAEYIIYLPKDWNVGSEEIENYWPIRVLKEVARIPVSNDSWLYYGHSVQSDEEGSPYAPNTRFNSAVLKFGSNDKGDIRCIMSSGKVINFYEVIPLYPEELQYKMDNDANALFKLFEDKNIAYRIVDINRKCAVD